VQRGVALIRVFRSPVAALHALGAGDHRVPFDVLADPGRVAYRLYGVGGRFASLWSMVTGRALGRIREARRAGLRGDWRDALRDGISGNPADFLIGPDGRIARARYGAHFADSLLPKEALEWIDAAAG
jgi:peroxiredoxin